MSLSILILCTSTVVCIVRALWRRTSVSTPPLDVPLVEYGDGEESKLRYINETGKLLKEGYDKYLLKRGQPFLIHNIGDPNRPMVFLPLHYMEEKRNAPQDRLRLPLYTEKTSILNYVNGPAITEEVHHAAHLNLNKSLNNLIQPLQEQCKIAAAKTMPECPDWTPVHVYPIILQLFAHMSARVMVGPDLCVGWPAISLRYLNAALKAPGAVRQKCHPWFYWYAKFFSPEVKEVIKKERGDARRAGPDIFITMVASTHGTSTIAYSVLLDLLAHPDACAEIKDEIDRVKKDELHDGNAWSRHALGELRLFDSFMREMHPMHPFTEATMQRTVVVPYTFKDGLKLADGLSVNFTSLQHSMDRDLHGPDAETFDPRRWAKKRQGFDTSKFQFASTSDDWLNWGGGPHACPRRFMADMTIKLVLIYLLTNYDIKYPDGTKTRPPDGRRSLMITPDMTTPLLFKRTLL